MKNIVYILLVFILVSCSKYGEDGDGKGNLRYEMLTEDCETKLDVMSLIFMHPSNKTTCYMLYKDEKFTGAAASYYDNGHVKFILRYEEGVELTSFRKEYDVNGEIITEPFMYEFEEF